MIDKEIAMSTTVFAVQEEISRLEEDIKDRDCLIKEAEELSKSRAASLQKVTLSLVAQ